MSLTAEDLPARFERNYAENRAWRNERGFTEAEAGRVLVRGAQRRDS